MLSSAQTPMKIMFLQHVSSIRPLKNKLFTDEIKKSTENYFINNNLKLLTYDTQI